MELLAAIKNQLKTMSLSLLIPVLKQKLIRDNIELTYNWNYLISTRLDRIEETSISINH